MQVYNETYIGTACRVEELICLLSSKVPKLATVDIASLEHTADVEVWYDKDTNTVILK